MRKFSTGFYTAFHNARRRSRGRLPHLEADDAAYSITYRMADSLPLRIVRLLREDRQALLRQLRDASAIERSEALEVHLRRADSYLDRGYGSCHLRDERIAAIVVGNLHFHDRKLYDLMAWSVMPNHVHVLMKLFRGSDLARVMHAWKSYTSKEANKILRRTGTFWEEEYWDRLIRDENDLHATSAYIVNNHVNAGLPPSKFSGCKVECG